MPKTFKTVFMESLPDRDLKDSKLISANMSLDEIPRKGEEFVYLYQQWEVTNIIRNFDEGDNEIKVIVKKVEKTRI